MSEPNKTIGSIRKAVRGSLWGKIEKPILTIECGQAKIVFQLEDRHWYSANLYYQEILVEGVQNITLCFSHCGSHTKREIRIETDILPPWFVIKAIVQRQDEINRIEWEALGWSNSSDSPQKNKRRE